MENFHSWLFVTMLTHNITVQFTSGMCVIKYLLFQVYFPTRIWISKWIVIILRAATLRWRTWLVKLSRSCRKILTDSSFLLKVSRPLARSSDSSFHSLSLVCSAAHIHTSLRWSWVVLWLNITITRRCSMCARMGCRTFVLRAPRSASRLLLIGFADDILLT